MASDLESDDNPEWTERNTRPLDSSAKLKMSRGIVDMSQPNFAALLGIPLATLQNWEQRRTEPDPIARTLIDLVFDDPQGMLERLEKRKAA